MRPRAEPASVRGLDLKPLLVVGRRFEHSGLNRFVRPRLPHDVALADAPEATEVNERTARSCHAVYVHAL